MIVTSQHGTHIDLSVGCDYQFGRKLEVVSGIGKPAKGFA